ncbi:phage integrase family protein [Acidisarcina polymorpha]|uniref:Phage integrase family protein n=1 Tax=Acidisarcina polymorpha TaxID=2211140 RepID=A0A2Z5FUQ1_9BACT|nr:phage integrase family protein [Acidisarcina polymorpha]
MVNGVTSEHSRRSYTTGLRAFFTWIRISGAGRPLPRL